MHQHARALRMQRRAISAPIRRAPPVMRTTRSIEAGTCRSACGDTFLNVPQMYSARRVLVQEPCGAERGGTRARGMRMREPLGGRDRGERAAGSASNATWTSCCMRPGWAITARARTSSAQVETSPPRRRSPRCSASVWRSSAPGAARAARQGPADSRFGRRAGAGGAAGFDTRNRCGHRPPGGGRPVAAGSTRRAARALSTFSMSAPICANVNSDSSRRGAARLRPRVHWLEAPPSEDFDGVILANEVLDALPVARFRWHPEGCEELGVGLEQGRLAWMPRPASESMQRRVRCAQRRPAAAGTTATCRSIAHGSSPGRCMSLVRSRRAWCLWIDYGLPRPQYYFRERREGTLMCHFRQRAHGDPFLYPGLQDVTAWVDFTALAQCEQIGRVAAGLASPPRRTSWRASPSSARCRVSRAAMRAALRAWRAKHGG